MGRPSDRHFIGPARPLALLDRGGHRFLTARPDLLEELEASSTRRGVDLQTLKARPGPGVGKNHTITARRIPANDRGRRFAWLGPGRRAPGQESATQGFTG